MTQSTILVVEDESVVALDIKLQLEDLGFRILGPVARGEAALTLAANHRPDLTLMDIRLAGEMDGVATAAQLSAAHAIPVVFLTSHSDADTVRRAAETGAYGYLTKPFQIKELRAGIEVALTKARLERQLKESERWFASTLKCVQDGVVVTEQDARVRFMNPAAERLTGWRLEDALGKAVSQVLPFQPDAADATSASLPNAVDQVLAEGRVVGVRHARTLMTRTQDWVPVDESAGPVDDDFGRPMGAVVVIRDARGRLVQEAQLRSSEARFRNAFDHAPLGMALVSMAGRFIQVNAALSQLLAMAPETLQDRLVGEFSASQDMSHEAMRLQALTVGGAPLVQFEKRFLRGTKRDAVWTLVSVSLISQDDEPTCFLYQIHDLTDQKNAAEHLAALAEQRIKLEVSEQVMRSREDFFSRASHEMRTPLNAVLGFAQLLQLAQDDDSERTRHHADQIITAGKHLLEMVNDVLDIRRASSGELRLKLDAVPLGDAVRTVIEMLTPGAQGLGVSLSMQVPDVLHVQADPTRLRQVLFNVIGNGVKYNRSGGSVQVRAHADSLGIELIVSDTGLGLRPDQLDHIFQPFNRLGREHSSVEGVGLGLVITRNLLEKMGGSIHVESEPDVGTQVVMRFVTDA